MLFKTADPFERCIVLKLETWVYKICNYFGTNSNGEHGNSHPEMEEYKNEIELSVSNPHMITTDPDHEHRQHYYRNFVDNSKNNRWRTVKTVVEFEEKWESGEVVTSHLINKVVIGGEVVYDSSTKTTR